MKIAKLERGLDTALNSIDSGSKKERNITIMKRYFGFDGLGGTSMEEAGLPFSLTRESVRQITNRIASVFPSALPFVPEIKQAIEIILQMAPCAASDVEKALVQKSLISADFKIEGVINAAKCFGIVTDELSLVKLNDMRFVVTPATEKIPSAINSLAIKDISHNGAVSVSTLALVISDEPDAAARKLVGRVIESMSGVTWIDGKEWFYFTGRGRNRLVTRINKVFSVLNNVPVSALISGIIRSWNKNLKENTALLPSDKLIDLIKTLDGFKVSRTGVISRDDAFSNNDEVRPFEYAIAEFINSKENKVGKEKEIEDAIVLTTQDKYNFSMALNYSPLITKRERPEGSPEGKYYRGQYVLIGDMRS